MKQCRDPSHRARIIAWLRSPEFMQELFGPHTAAELIEIERQLKALDQQPKPQQELNLITR